MNNISMKAAIKVFRENAHVFCKSGSAIAIKTNRSHEKPSDVILSIGAPSSGFFFPRSSQRRTSAALQSADRPWRATRVQIAFRVGRCRLGVLAWPSRKGRQSLAKGTRLFTRRPRVVGPGVSAISVSRSVSHRAAAAGERRYSVGRWDCSGSRCFGDFSRAAGGGAVRSPGLGHD